MAISSDQSRAFRDALGQFATGITIITALDEKNQPTGLTVNSFSSVSLDPRLVLWSISDEASVYDAFIKAKHFAIHVLHSGQQALSNSFASVEGDRFEGLALEAGISDVPLLTEYVARFECSTEAIHPGGDHEIIVGKVERFATQEREPLLFYGGSYREVKQ